MKPCIFARYNRKDKYYACALRPMNECRHGEFDEMPCPDYEE